MLSETCKDGDRAGNHACTVGGVNVGDTATYCEMTRPGFENPEASEFWLEGANMVYPEAAGPTTYTYYHKATVEECEKHCTALSGCTVFSFGDYGCRVPVYKAVGSAVNNVFTVVYTV